MVLSSSLTSSRKKSEACMTIRMMRKMDVDDHEDEAMEELSREQRPRQANATEANIT